jgi:Ca-activated chloride channel family protein
MRFFKVNIVFLILLFVFKTSFAQQTDQAISLTRILFVFDASQSMLAKWETDSKINVAKKMMSTLLDSLSTVENLEVALRVYGHQYVVPPQRCDDTRLEVPFAKNNFTKIKGVINNLQPQGTTPIARSLESAALDFPKSTKSRNIIILITDGIEACDGDPCAVSLALQKQGVMLKPFVIGVGLDIEFKKTFECVGQYFDAANETQFKEVLGIVISQALNNTSLQVNLLDKGGNPTETDVNMTFYDKQNGKMKYNFIHTLNNRGVPDTLILDQLPTYRLVAHTIPPVFIDSIKLTPGKHTVVAADAPQGYLIVKANTQQYKELDFIVRQKGKMNTINVQNVNATEKYIVGSYDIEVLSLPRLLINDIDVAQSHTTTVRIPDPGMITFMMDAAGYGSVYVEKDNKLEWVVNLDNEAVKQTYTLLPGNYQVSWRAKNVKRSMYTLNKTFKIVSGSSIPLYIK